MSSKTPQNGSSSDTTPRRLAAHRPQSFGALVKMTTPEKRVLNVSVGILGHIDSGKTSLGAFHTQSINAAL